MELTTIISVIFIGYTVYLFLKPIKRDTSISKEEAISYFFKQSEVTAQREIIGTFTNGIAVYKNKDTNQIRAIKQAKLCDSSLI